jgi:hypothetical protein
VRHTEPRKPIYSIQIKGKFKYVGLIISGRCQDAYVSHLSAIENQKALNIGLAKPTSVQQVLTTMDGELSHNHYADILNPDTTDLLKGVVLHEVYVPW